MRFTVVDTIHSTGRLVCRILDTKSTESKQYLSTEIDPTLADWRNEQEGYIQKTVEGEWVDGLEFSNGEHAMCMAAALNLGAKAIQDRTFI